MMSDPFIGMCRLCFKGNMSLDYDTDIVTCIDCGTKFEIIYGKWMNPGTDDAHRPMFLGKQIKDE